MKRLADAPSGDDIRRVVDEVMAGPEFAVPKESWFEEIRRTVFENVRDFLGDLFSGLFDLVPEEGLARTLVIGWMVLTLLAICAHFIWTIMKLRRPAVIDDGVIPATSSPHELVTWQSALARARASADAGHLDDAMAALYRGTVLWLDDAGDVVAEESKTGGDYARELRDAAQRTNFRALLRSYYPVAFGGRAAGAALWDAMRACAVEIGVPVT